MKKTSLIILLTIGLVFTTISITQAQTPQDTLNQYISDLQKNPNDNALREKIIKHVQTMKPAPAIPEDANRHFVMADTFREKAKDNKGYELAISEYKEALLVAPWWAVAYNNMGILLEQVGRYDEAISFLKLYIATNPPDTRAAQNKIYQIEASKKLAAQESNPEAIAERENKKADDFLKSLNGARYLKYVTSAHCGRSRVAADIRGEKIIMSHIIDGPRDLDCDAWHNLPVGVWERFGECRVINKKKQRDKIYFETESKAQLKCPPWFTISNDGEALNLYMDGMIIDFDRERL
jgi:tetratricopeptide (TPR) repeat protein